MQDHQEIELSERAAEWLLRLESADCTPDDRRAFEIWKALNPAHAEMVSRLSDGQVHVDLLATDPAIDRLVQQVIQDTEPRALFSHPRFLKGAVAASVAAAASLAIIFGGTILQPSDHINDSPSLAGDTSAPSGVTGDMTAVMDVRRYQTARGERSSVELSDGTNIQLNSDTLLEAVYSENDRVIKLDRGQAFFDVAKDASRPFIVEAGDQKIIAIGTQFDVNYLNTSSIAVTLIEGDVAVEPQSPIETVTASSSVRLKPGEQFVASNDGAPNVVETQTEHVLAWRDGKAIYRREPLKSVVAEMNMLNARTIILSDDPRLEAIEISGVFKIGSTTSFVDALQLMHPIKVIDLDEERVRLDWIEH